MVLDLHGSALVHVEVVNEDLPYCGCIEAQIGSG